MIIVAILLVAALVVLALCLKGDVSFAAAIWGAKIALEAKERGHTVRGKAKATNRSLASRKPGR